MNTLYLGSPLFSEAELAFNRTIRDLLKGYFEVYLPQEDGGLMLDMINDGMPLEQAQRFVFSCDIDAIRRSDYFLAILDGRSVDEGASFELGFAYALGKRCIGYQSDPRRLLTVGNNPMLECSLERILTSRSDLLEWAALEAGALPAFRSRRLAGLATRVGGAVRDQ